MVNGLATVCECRGVILAAIVDVASVGLPLMALLIAAESMGVPLPGETALIAAAVLASRGHFPIEAVIVLAATAAIVGDNLGFAISRRYGRSVVLHPRIAHHGERLLAVGEPFFEKHGPKTVFLGRWVAGLRIGAAWLAGLNGMRWPSFLFWNATGGIFWATTVGLVAYWLGHSAEKIFKTAGFVGAGVAVAGGLAAYAYIRMRRRRREPA
jgi:membrane protein DedA with SNARE-associated domain